jgi:hypothetical protein
LASVAGARRTSPGVPMTDGFHAYEADNDIRWTDGDAGVPHGLFEGFAGDLWRSHCASAASGVKSYLPHDHPPVFLSAVTCLAGQRVWCQGLHPAWARTTLSVVTVISVQSLCAEERSRASSQPRYGGSSDPAHRSAGRRLVDPLAASRLTELRSCEIIEITDSMRPKCPEIYTYAILSTI